MSTSVSMPSLLSLLFALMVGAEAARPNVLLLWCDDVGYGDLGFTGNTTMKTPRLDALARSGAVLTQHLVASPLCTPSRAALMTGRHAIRVGMTSAHPNFNVMGLGPGSLPQEETTIAEALRDRGYRTCMVGKWHLGGTADPVGLPSRHGFDTYWGMPITNVQSCRAGHQEYPHSTLLSFVATRTPTKYILGTLLVLALTPWLVRSLSSWRVCASVVALLCALPVFWFAATLTLINSRACFLYANETLIEQPAEIGYLTLRHTERAEACIESRPPTTPLLLYLSYANAHTALFAMDSSVGRSSHGAYGDNVEEMDWSVGRVLDALERRGELKNTLIYFASDNGPFREELDESGSCGYGPTLSPGVPLVTRTAAGWSDSFSRAAAPLKGGKAQTWECGLRVPSILAYPARWPGGRAVHVATSAMDILPTVLAVVDGEGGGSQAEAPRLPFSHVSDLKGNEKAGPRVLDGRSLVPLFDGLAAAVRRGAKAENAYAAALPATAVHDFIFHYCAARVSSVRHGVWKVHYTTTRWEDEQAQICRNNVICNCHGHEHNPPLLYNIHEDPAEITPLDVTTAQHTDILRTIAEAKARHEATLVPYPSQTELLPMPHHFPCCGVERGSWQHYWSVFNNLCGC
jgi:steryl-sulfatase